MELLFGLGKTSGLIAGSRGVALGFVLGAWGPGLHPHSRLRATLGMSGHLPPPPGLQSKKARCNHKGCQQTLKDANPNHEAGLGPGRQQAKGGQRCGRQAWPPMLQEAHRSHPGSTQGLGLRKCSRKPLARESWVEWRVPSTTGIWPVRFARGSSNLDSQHQITTVRCNFGKAEGCFPNANHNGTE